MPIKTSADKVAREIQQYGNPLAFPMAQESSGAAVMDAGCFLVECMVLLRSTILIFSSSQQGLLLSLYTNSYPGSQKTNLLIREGYEPENKEKLAEAKDYMDDDLLFPAMQARSECTLDLENQMEETVHVYAENRQVFGDSVQDYELLEASLWSRLVERFGKKPCLNSTGEDTEELAVGKVAAEHGKQVCTCFCVTIFDCVVLNKTVQGSVDVECFLEGALDLYCGNVSKPDRIKVIFLYWITKLPKEVIDQLEFQNALPRALIWSPIDPSADNRNRIIELLNYGADKMAEDITIEGFKSSADMLVDYMKKYPMCPQILLISARLDTKHGACPGLKGFDELIFNWST
ncbi:hypothetical protein HU200_015414 [Digitaria exilis]|uniref:Uncharacterized protein n=1 Tax=Digitaria exilis TaxID=1010633 RepID=A0A835FAJ7_9POAL|nr:hypothetical protein HU200_015414 [Digitaria exilis]